MMMDKKLRDLEHRILAGTVNALDDWPPDYENTEATLSTHSGLDSGDEITSKDDIENHFLQTTMDWEKTLRKAAAGTPQGICMVYAADDSCLMQGG